MLDKQSRFFKIIIGLLPIVLIGLFRLYIQPVYASIIIVDDGTSVVAVDGKCSLREAIQNANDNAGTNVDCVAGVGVDTISIETDIILDLNDHTNFAVPAIIDPLIIEGNGHSITGSGTSLGFVDFSNSLSFQNITISGFSNIVLWGNGELSIEDSTFSGNTESVAYSNGGGDSLAWTVTNSTFNNNSSSLIHGILSKEDGGNLTITNSVFSNNTKGVSGDGSAIRYLGGNASETLSIAGSTFYNNIFTTGGCGAVGVSGSFDLNVEINNTVFDSNVSEYCGGALSIETGYGTLGNINLTITNSLFKENIANPTDEKSGGAIYVQNNMNLTLVNNIFYGNSSGIKGGAIQIFSEDNGKISMNASHNTFYGNTSGDGNGNDIYIGSGATGVSFVENNIFSGGVDDCGGDFSNVTFTNNLSNDTDCGATNAVTGLDTNLANNGGSFNTLALLYGSNAVNTAVEGTLSCPAEDIRGESRPVGSACDIGSFEALFLKNTATVLESDNETIVSEDGTQDTYTIVLDTLPTDDVTINFVYDNTKILVSPASLVFTTTDWDTPQVVTVSAVEDGVSSDEDTTISHTTSSSDTAYNEIIVDSVSVHILNVQKEDPKKGDGGGRVITGGGKVGDPIPDDEPVVTPPIKPVEVEIPPIPPPPTPPKKPKPTKVKPEIIEKVVEKPLPIEEMILPEPIKPDIITKYPDISKEIVVETEPIYIESHITLKDKFMNLFKDINFKRSADCACKKVTTLLNYLYTKLLTSKPIYYSRL